MAAFLTRVPGAAHSLVSRLRCSVSAISAFTRVFDALWRETVHR
jgi:hypothetical protein